MNHVQEDFEITEKKASSFQQACVQCRGYSKYFSSEKMSYSSWDSIAYVMMMSRNNISLQLKNGVKQYFAI